jgi:hypothetical protein
LYYGKLLSSGCVVRVIVAIYRPIINIWPVARINLVYQLIKREDTRFIGAIPPYPLTLQLNT